MSPRRGHHHHRRHHHLLVALAALAHVAYSEVKVTGGAQGTSAFPSADAEFGEGLPKNGLAGIVQVAKPLYACSQIDHPQDGHTRIALIQRGPPAGEGGDACTFYDKVANAQAAGFKAVIIFDYENDELAPMGSRNDSDFVTIPSVFITLDDGDAIQDRVLHATVQATLFPSQLPEWPNFLMTVTVIVASVVFIFGIVMFYRRRTRRRAERLNILSSREILALPSHTIDEVDPDDANACCICLCDYEIGDVVTELRCKHIFHKTCIHPWLTERRRVCPICKRDPCPDENSPLLDGSPA